MGVEILGEIRANGPKLISASKFIGRAKNFYAIFDGEVLVDLNESHGTKVESLQELSDLMRRKRRNLGL